MDLKIVEKRMNAIIRKVKGKREVMVLTELGLVLGKETKIGNKITTTQIRAVFEENEKRKALKLKIFPQDNRGFEIILQYVVEDKPENEDTILT